MYPVGLPTPQDGSEGKEIQAADLLRGEIVIILEQESLAKSFTGSFYRISKMKNGKFKVTLPGLLDSKTGYYVGATSTEFDSWGEARNFYLQKLENEAILAEHPIIQLRTSETEQISFSAFDAFNPKVAPSKKPSDIPQSIAKYILQQEKMAGEAPSASTYQETIKKEDWERKIYAFISEYLEGNGKKIMGELSIKNLDLLTPRQAVSLTIRIIIELTKYKWSDAKDIKSDSLIKKTEADQSAALDLLKMGLANKRNGGWEGNGVCRNFASMTKAVFEALKANQTKFNRLQNTYCLYDDGMNEFAPRRIKKNVIEMNRPGHAWNTFVTILNNKANATIIDTTWAKNNLDTGEVEDLDHTLTRMEPVIHQVATNLGEILPNRDVQLKHILDYYQLKMESMGVEPNIKPISVLSDEEKKLYKLTAKKYLGDKYDLSQFGEDQLIQIGQQFQLKLNQLRKQKEERQFFSSRILDIIGKQKSIPDISPNLLQVIGEDYISLADDLDISEIETLWCIYKQNPDFPFGDILKAYLKDKDLTDYHAMDFISNNDELQQAIFEQIKTHQKFEKFMEDSSTFRTRILSLIK